MLKTTTPPCISPEILKFATELGCPAEPVYLTIQNFPESRTLNSFLNVQAQVNLAGGAIQHGWTIWDRSGLYLEAIFHAVWVNPAGDFVEITPHAGTGRILFLADPLRKLELKPVQPKRFILRKMTVFCRRI